MLKRKNLKYDKVGASGDPFDEVIGLEEVKRVLYEAIVLPMKHPQLFAGELNKHIHKIRKQLFNYICFADGRYQWSRILLFGPPGTG